MPPTPDLWDRLDAIRERCRVVIDSAHHGSDSPRWLIWIEPRRGGGPAVLVEHRDLQTAVKQVIERAEEAGWLAST
jgi:hypothetical protein